MDSFAPFDGRQPTFLTVPGLGGSGPSHWQTLWEAAHADTIRAELGMWDTPHRNVWVTRLDEAIRRARAPVILAAHSLGCIAMAWWAELAPQPYGWPVAGALLVAPADVERRGCQHELAGFTPTPRKALPFPSIVVASNDDPWVSPERAHSMAADWGCHFVDAGEQGHLNAASGIGAWHEGRDLLDRVIAASSDGRGHAKAPSEARSIWVRRSSAGHARAVWRSLVRIRIASPRHVGRVPASTEPHMVRLVARWMPEQARHDEV